MPSSAPSALHTALRRSRIAGPARDAKAVTIWGVHNVHGQGLGKISRSKQYRLGTPPPPCRPPTSRRMSPAWRIVPFNLEESFHWPASHVHLLFHWPVHGCQRVPISEISLACLPWLCPQAFQKTFVVSTHNVDHNLAMWELLRTPFHRTNWVCGLVPPRLRSTARGGGSPPASVARHPLP